MVCLDRKRDTSSTFSRAAATVSAPSVCLAETLLNVLLRLRSRHSISVKV